MFIAFLFLIISLKKTSHYNLQLFFWHIVLGKNYIRDAERMAEEGIELIGYTMIAFGCIDYVLILNKTSAAETSI